METPQKFPTVIRDISQEFDKMITLGINIPTNKPPLCTTESKMEVSLDLMDKNAEICRDYHLIPNRTELKHEFASSQFFSKFTGKHCYWCTVFPKVSSLSCSTANMHIINGSDSHLVMYAARMSQYKMDEILECYGGTISITVKLTKYAHKEKEHDACFKMY